MRDIPFSPLGPFGPLSRKAALAAAAAFALALAVTSPALTRPAIPHDTPGLGLVPPQAVDLGPAGALLAWLAHGASCALVVLVVSRLSRKLLPGLAAGLIFAAHPVNVQAVAWSEARAVPVAFALALGASVLWFEVGAALATLDRRLARAAVRCASLLLLAAAAFLHPAASAAPVCLAAALTLRRRGSNRDGQDEQDTYRPASCESRPSLSDSARERRRLSADWVIVLAALLFFFLGVAFLRLRVPPVPGSAFEAAALPALLLDGIGSMLVPWRLLPEYSLLYAGAGTWTLVYGLVGLLVVFPVAERLLAKRFPAARPGLSWIAVALVFSVVLLAGGARADWALYLALVGVAYLAGEAVSLLPTGAAAGVLAVALAGLGAKAVYQTGAWRGPREVLVAMNGVPARAQLELARRYALLAERRERERRELDHEAAELRREGRDELARETREEAGRADSEAIMLFQRAMSALTIRAQRAFDPGDAEYLAGKGEVVFRQGRYDLAREILERALDRTPAEEGNARSRTLVLLGKIAARTGMARKAVESYRKATEADGSNGEAFCNLGSVLVAFRKPAEALVALKRAEELAPADAALQNELGHVYELMLSFEDAKRAYAKAVDLAPHRDDYRTDLEAILGIKPARTDPAAARREFAEGEELEAQARRALALGEKLQAKGFLLAACDAFRKAIAHVRSNHAAYYRRGMCLREYALLVPTYRKRRELLAEALGHFDIACTLRPEREDYRFALARGYQDMGRPGKAEETLRAILRENDKSAEAHYLLARLYAYLMHDAERARRELEKAVKLGFKPEPEFLYELANIEAGPLSPEEKKAEEAARAASSRAELLAGHAKDFAAAAAAYAEAFESLAGHERPSLVIGRAKAAAGAGASREELRQYDEALGWFEKASALAGRYAPGIYAKDVRRVKRLIRDRVEKTGAGPRGGPGK